jgi:nicotinic acid mononucleotide adenylyltransferase
MVENPASDKYSVPVERIFQIHKSPCKVVLAITGGGAEIIGELLRHGSGSATVLDAVVPYSTDAMDRFLGRKPEKYCSEKTARLMAMVAYQRALELSKSSAGAAGQEVIGIGATCKLKAANEREGRKHEVHVAIQAACKTGVCTLELTAQRTREEEERIASLLIFNMLARHCGVSEIDLPVKVDAGEGKKEKVVENYESVSSCVGDLLKQKTCGQDDPYENLSMTRIDLKGEKAPEGPEEPHKIRLVFPGSFDPCHRNHVFMAKIASEKLGEPVHFEISLTNVDKPPIDFISLNQRLDSLREYKDEEFMGGVCLTNAPLFLQKANLFPDSTFIIGADTFNRLFDAKYYGGKLDTSAILNCFKEKKIRFMVFQRKSVEFCISPEVLEFCEIVPMDEYEDDGTSSREIRRKHENNTENSNTYLNEKQN